MLGAVLGYGQVVVALQDGWREAQTRAPQRLHERFGARVRAVKNVVAPAAAEVDRCTNAACTSFAAVQTKARATRAPESPPDR